MIHTTDIIARERAKYAGIWADVPDYRKWSPGLDNVDRFIDVMKPQAGSSIIDIGCGVGLAGLQFARRGFDVWWLDITDEGLDPSIDLARFIEAPIWSDWGEQWDYGFICDVMEHIPTEYVMLTIERILRSCRTTWFVIALKEDDWGSMLIGEPLHLTVRPYEWWLSRFSAIGEVTDARDLIVHGLYIVRRHGS